MLIQLTRFFFGSKVAQGLGALSIALKNRPNLMTDTSSVASGKPGYFEIDCRVLRIIFTQKSFYRVFRDA